VIDARPDCVWDAIRDVGAVHRRLLPDRVLNTHLDGDVRTLTLAHGGVYLRYFVAVAEELHFTRAAERLFVTQPALSKQVRTLERQLGAPLFARDRREVRLTPVGTALLPRAQRMLAEWDTAREAAEQAKSAQRARTGRGDDH
jgi:DNA-binding MarR family transcriptional regulator